MLQQNLTLAQHMQNKSNKAMEFKAGKADKNFTVEPLTNFMGLTSVSEYIRVQGIGSLPDRLFPTVKNSGRVCKNVNKLK